MRVLLVGATGTIGRAVGAALSAVGHEVVGVSRSSSPLAVELGDPASIRRLFERVGELDAVVCCAGQPRFGALGELEEEDFAVSLGEKLMGQVNFVRRGFERLRDGGSITLTAGTLPRRPKAGAALAALVNGALEGFVRSAALDAPRGLRVNVVSPHWVSETLVALGMDPAAGVPASELAALYVRAVTGGATGQVFEA